MKRYKAANYTPFYVWFFVTCLIGIGAYWAGYNGVYEIFWNTDVSHLTQVIALVVIIANFRLGWLSWRWAREYNYYEDTYLNEYASGDILSPYPNPFDDTTQISSTQFWNDAFKFKVRKHIDEWLYAAKFVMLMGLLTTVIGFSVLFHYIMKDVGISGFTPETLLKVIPELFIPMSTIFLGTIAGLVGNMIITLQTKLFISFSGINDDQYETEAYENEENAS